VLAANVSSKDKMSNKFFFIFFRFCYCFKFAVFTLRFPHPERGGHCAFPHLKEMGRGRASILISDYSKSLLQRYELFLNPPNFCSILSACVMTIISKFFTYPSVVSENIVIFAAKTTENNNHTQ
jgi:hypothetical protein